MIPPLHLPLSNIKTSSSRFGIKGSLHQNLRKKREIVAQRHPLERKTSLILRQKSLLLRRAQRDLNNKKTINNIDHKVSKLHGYGIYCILAQKFQPLISVYTLNLSLY